MAHLTDTLRLKLELDHRKRPLVHLLRTDGTVQASLRHAVIAVPDDPADEKANQVYALLINGHGDVFQQEDGNPAVLQAVPFQLVEEWQPARLMSEKELCFMLDMPPSTLDRRVKDETFPQPIYTSERRKAWRWGEIKEWISCQPRTYHEKLVGIEQAKRMLAKVLDVPS